MQTFDTLKVGDRAIVDVSLVITGVEFPQGGIPAVVAEVDDVQPRGWIGLTIADPKHPLCGWLVGPEYRVYVRRDELAAIREAV